MLRINVNKLIVCAAYLIQTKQMKTKSQKMIHFGQNMKTPTHIEMMLYGQIMIRYALTWEEHFCKSYVSHVSSPKGWILLMNRLINVIQIARCAPCPQNRYKIQSNINDEAGETAKHFLFKN